MILNLLKKYAQTDRIAYIHHNTSENICYSYRDLDKESDRLASYLNKYSENKNPVLIYGHKDHRMITAFIASVKSGRPYCPIDTSFPKDRIVPIIDQVQPSFIIAIEPLDIEYSNTISSDQLNEIIRTEEITITKDQYVKENDLYYIIFTSGSTGVPKGVMITYNNLNEFAKWSATLYSKEDPAIFINQAPFSFDLSVMDIYTSLYTGSTIFAIDKNIQSDFSALMNALKESNATDWVSTPSFADLVLADRTFNQDLMPRLRRFLFCGEILQPKTCQKLMKRFENAKIINTYGPTESTVAVTSIEITKEIIERFESLPIGIPKDGITITFEENGKPTDSGEMILTGDTVGKGYYKSEEQTKKAFFYQSEKAPYPSYRTGDLGYKKEGLYFCNGRIDQQIKLHGYRIELGDIECHINHLDEVEQCAVICNKRNGKIERLTACIVPKVLVKDPMKTTLELKEKLSKDLLSYMIPQRFVYIEKMPMNRNGKIDRKILEEM